MPTFTTNIFWDICRHCSIFFCGFQGLGVFPLDSPRNSIHVAATNASRALTTVQFRLATLSKAFLEKVSRRLCRSRRFFFIVRVWEYAHWIRLEILHILPLQMPRELLRQSSLGLQLYLTHLVKNQPMYCEKYGAPVSNPRIQNPIFYLFKKYGASVSNPRIQNPIFDLFLRSLVRLCPILEFKTRFVFCLFCFEKSLVFY